MRKDEKSHTELFKGNKPKNISFHLNITDEQIKAHQQRDIKDIFNWLESTNQFISSLQNLDDKERNKDFKMLVK